MEQFMLQLGIMSLQACVVIGVVFCVRWIFLKAGVAGKYTCLLWFLPYLCMICPWKVEVDYGFWRQWELPTERMEVFFNEEIVPNVDEGTGIYETLAENAGAMEDLQGEAITGNIWNDVESPTQGQLTAWIVWLAGLLVILIYSADAYLKLHTKLICCRKLTDNIYLADDIDVPFVMGIWRPRIYLPSGIAKENLSYVIAHEQTHIKRQDLLKKGVAYIITGLHWFNPFAWAAFYFLCKDMETACDEETILALGLEHKQDYARVLLQISSGQKMFFGAPLAFGEGSVKSRIKHIVSFKKTWRVVSVLFKEDAFTAVNAGEISFAEENVPSMNHVRPTVVQRESAKSLAYDIQGKSLTYHVPKHTVALKSGELTWELYAYAGNGDRWIGTIYAGPTTEVEKNAGDAGIPKEKGAGVFCYEASLFSKAQQGSIDGRENVSALKNIRKKYTQEILVSKDGTEMIKVFMVDFD